MALTRDSITDHFLSYIALNFQVEKDEINIDQSLVDEGIIDSFGLIEIAGFMQDEYSVSVNEEDMVRENFGSVTKIAEFILRKAKIEENNTKMQKVCSV